MKKVAVLLAAVGILLIAAPAAFADHRGGHYPPACGNASENSKGTAGGTKAGNSGQTCSQVPPGQARKSFQFPQEARDGGITVGILVIAGLGAFTLFIAARTLTRRRVIS